MRRTYHRRWYQQCKDPTDNRFILCIASYYSVFMSRSLKLSSLPTWRVSWQLTMSVRNWTDIETSTMDSQRYSYQSYRQGSRSTKSDDRTSTGTVWLEDSLTVLIYWEIFMDHPPPSDWGIMEVCVREEHLRSETHHCDRKESIMCYRFDPSVCNKEPANGKKYP